MMVVALGALTSIPKDVLEAAEVDGATRWQRFRHITLPLLRPTLLPAVVLGAVWTFNMFNVVFLVSGGEPDGTTDILVSEAYRWAFARNAQYGYAAAYAVIIFGLLALHVARARRDRRATRRRERMSARCAETDRASPLERIVVHACSSPRSSSRSTRCCGWSRSRSRRQRRREPRALPIPRDRVTLDNFRVVTGMRRPRARLALRAAARRTRSSSRSRRRVVGGRDRHARGVRARALRLRRQARGPARAARSRRCSPASRAPSRST